MNLRKTQLFGFILLSVVTFGSQVSGQTSRSKPEWTYTLLPGSQLTDDCPVCGRPPIILPLRGTFRLRLLEENPLFSRYELSDIAFTAGAAPGNVYRVTGRGTYQVGGEFAFLQELSLQVLINNGQTNTRAFLTSGPRPVERLWPILQIAADQTNGTPTQVYYLALVAAPARDVWFSTAHGFTSSHGQPPNHRVSPGDLLSTSGQVVKRNHDLTARLGIMPVVPDLGLDAVDMLPNGERIFSLEEDIFSETLGPLQHGDLLVERGRIVARNQELYAAFAPMPSPEPPDVGLDAAQMLADGEIYFSIEKNLFSEKLGVMLRPGDLLSNRGRIVKNNQQLLARFHPPPMAGPVPRDYGLDAIHAWPSGEIWFSLEEGFQDANLGPILPGDLLSDQGYVVFGNLELLNAFAPVEDLADFGCDALAVISGAILPPPSMNRVWQYRLLTGSGLTDDCLICGRPTIVVRMRGSFGLRLVEENPLFARYAVEDISFAAGSPPGFSYQVNGHGTYQVGGEVALRQEMFLEVFIDDGRTYKLCFFTNETSTVDRLWPMIHITVDQTNGTLLQTYTLELDAAPLREIWFSTTHDFHAGIWQAPSNFISAGDWVSSTGRIVKRNQDLAARLGIMPLVPDLGLDAADVLPGGEVAFSIEQDIFSETIGPLHHGDVLSDRGRVVRSYVELIGAFGPEPPPADEGVDALQVLSEHELYFSVETDFFSERLGRPIRRGDLLSGRSVVVKDNSELLARFHPPPIPKDFGLDAIYLWPSGEIWFSLEEGFQDDGLGSVQPGDLLSDQGYVVDRNLELMSAFKPLERLADFGLDAMFIVTDALAPGPPPRITRVHHQPGTDVVELEWEATGRVFQVLRGTNVLGPWWPVTPILPDTMFRGMAGPARESFFRLQQW